MVWSSLIFTTTSTAIQTAGGIETSSFISTRTHALTAKTLDTIVALHDRYKWKSIS